MKDFLQMLEEAIPGLHAHHVLVVRLGLVALLVFLAYRAKGTRRKICRRWLSKLERQIWSTSRWLYVHQHSQLVNDWKYYTSETTGKGEMGDDVIWTLVTWPSLKPEDTFTVPRAVGMIDGITESQAILKGRWNIVHDPDSLGVGFVPARGAVSKLRRAAAKILLPLCGPRVEMQRESTR